MTTDISARACRHAYRLAEHAGTDAMMTSQVLRRREARGLLDRHPDPADGRAAFLAALSSLGGGPG